LFQILNIKSITEADDGVITGIVNHDGELLPFVEKVPYLLKNVSLASCSPTVPYLPHDSHTTVPHTHSRESNVVSTSDTSLDISSTSPMTTSTVNFDSSSMVDFPPSSKQSPPPKVIIPQGNGETHSLGHRINRIIAETIKSYKTQVMALIVAFRKHWELTEETIGRSVSNAVLVAWKLRWNEAVDEAMCMNNAVRNV
jgi:hypothetical protein